MPDRNPVSFFGQIGFVEITVDPALPFLVAQMGYIFSDRGVDATIMRRGQMAVVRSLHRQHEGFQQLADSSKRKEGLAKVS